MSTRYSLCSCLWDNSTVDRITHNQDPDPSRSMGVWGTFLPILWVAKRLISGIVGVSAYLELIYEVPSRGTPLSTLPLLSQLSPYTHTFNYREPHSEHFNWGPLQEGWTNRLLGHSHHHNIHGTQTFFTGALSRWVQQIFCRDTSSKLHAHHTYTPYKVGIMTLGHLPCENIWE